MITLISFTDPTGPKVYVSAKDVAAVEPSTGDHDSCFVHLSGGRRLWIKGSADDVAAELKPKRHHTGPK